MQYYGSGLFEEYQGWLGEARYKENNLPRKHTERHGSLVGLTFYPDLCSDVVSLNSFYHCGSMLKSH